MANDDIIARFRLDIEGLNKDIAKIKDKLGDVESKAGKTAKNASKEFDQFGNAVNRLGKMMITVFAVDRIISFGKKMIDVTAQMQKFEAVLTNTLGSSKQAQIELNKISSFAAKTPLTIAEITENFIKLTNRGVKPTIAELTAFGDLALSLGKDLTQVTEAVLDINNPERWKELGIQAQTNGDKVKLTFRGVSHEVDRTVKGVSDAVVAFGQMEGVIGGMEKAAETLGGKISTLSDSWDQLMLAIGDASDDAMKRIISGATTALDSLTKLFNFRTYFDKQFGASTAETQENVSVEIFKQVQRRVDAGGTVQDETEREIQFRSIQLQGVRDELRLAKIELDKNNTEENKIAVQYAIDRVKYFSDLLDTLKKVKEGTIQLSELTITQADKERIKNEELEKARKKAEEEEAKRKIALEEAIRFANLTRRQQLEELIKQEELILQKKVGQERESKKAIDNLINYRGELSKLVTEEEFRLAFVRMVVELKEEEIRLDKEENEEFREKVKLMKEAKGVMMQEAKGVLTDDSASKPNIKDGESIEEQRLRFQAEATDRSKQLYSDYIAYLNNLDQERIKEIEENGESQLRALQDQLNRGLISEEGYQRAKQAQIRETDLRVKEAQRKQAERAKAIGIIEATVSASLAVARAFKDYQYPYSLGIAALVGASAFLQVSNIQNTNIPQFEKGGYIKGKRHKEGGVLIEAEGGEYMVNRQGTARHLEVIEAINNGYFDKLIYQDWVLPALEQQKKEFAKMKDKSFASNLADSLVVKAMIDEDRLINSDKNTRKILMSIDSKLGRNSYINKRYN